MLGSCFDQVRNLGPLVHNITNYVTVNDVANMLLACGGSPIMSDEPDDVEDITAICNGLNINIGTLNKSSIQGMLLAGKRANELNHPILLDPVGAGASALRTNTALDLMQRIHFTVIRGNVSEIKTLASGSGTTKGVDADLADAVTEETLDSAVSFAKDFAKKTGAVIAITGAIDLVADSEVCYIIRNGRAEMGRITGTGCQLSGMMTAFVAANPDAPVKATAVSVIVYGLVSCWMYMIGMGAALFTGESDIAQILLKAGLGIVGLLIVVFSTVTTTFLDAWSAGISSESIYSRVKGKYIAIGATVLGTVGAVFFPMDDITDFLYLIGSVFAPMIAIQIADYFLLKRQCAHKKLDVRNAIIWVLGFIGYRLLMTVDIPVGNTLPDMLLTMLLCIIASKVLRTEK